MSLEIQFPDPLLADDDGLVAVGGEISPDYLIAAYSQGLFPWYNAGEPVLWWSPNPRMILEPRNFKCSKSLRQALQNKKFNVKVDVNFSLVIEQCAAVSRRDQKGTWINDDIIQGYCDLHEMGLAHSVETYQGDKLVGGLYGVSLGNSFFGESMFHLVNDASKVALYYLCQMLLSWNYDFIDAQQSTAHLRSLGAVDIDREEFIDRLKRTLSVKTRKGKWKMRYADL